MCEILGFILKVNNSFKGDILPNHICIKSNKPKANKKTQMKIKTSYHLTSNIFFMIK